MMLAGTGKLLIDDSKKVLVQGGVNTKGKSKSKCKKEKEADADPMDNIVFKHDITIDQFEEKMKEKEHKRASDELAASAAGPFANWERKWCNSKKDKKIKAELAQNMKKEGEEDSTPPRGPRIPKVSGGQTGLT